MPDFRRPDFRGSGQGSQEPSLDAVRRTDAFIDALAGGRPAVPQDAADAELAALLGGWRDELRWPPATGLLSEADVTAAFNAGRAQKRSGMDPQRWTDTQKRTSAMRNRRGLSVIGASAAAVLCIGGFGAVVAGSGPGDALHGVRTMMFGAQKQVRDDQVGLAAKTELSQVQTLIAQGDWEKAQDKLVAVSTQVATIDDQQQKQELLDQFNDLSAKVVERDPAATAPPGVVYTVAPSSAALVPAVEPTSTPSAPPPPGTATATTSTTTSETPSSAGATSSPSTTSPATSSPSSASTTPAEATTSTAPQSQPTTTPTSAAPTTTTAEPPPATSAAAPSTTPAPASAAPTPVATSAEAPRAVSSTAQTPAETTVSQTPAPAPATAAPGEPGTAAPSEPAAAGESAPSAGVTTTVLVPVPAGP